MLFVGNYDHKIDGKQRMAIPADIRQELEAESQRKLYVVLVEGPMLAIYTEDGFKKRSEELDHSDQPPEEILLYEQMFYSNAVKIELDNQGRIRLPEWMLSEAKLDRDVTLLGVKDHLQIHDRQRWHEQKQELMARKGLLRNPRLAMRTPGGAG